MQKIISNDKRLKILIELIGFWIIGAMIYGETFSGRVANPDAWWNSCIYKTSWKWEASLGRYAIRFWQLLTGGSIHVFWVTALSILCLVLIAHCMILLFEIESIVAKVILFLFLAVNPTVQSTLTYYYCTLYYFAAYLMMVLALVILIKAVDTERKIKKTIAALIAIVLICVSLATYQAYIGVFLTLGLLYVIHMILYKECKLKKILSTSAYVLVGLAIGVISYVMSNKIILKLWYVTPADSRGFDSIGAVQWGNLGTQILGCYRNFYTYFFGTTMINNAYGTYVSRGMINAICLSVCVLILLYGIVIIKRKFVFKLLAVAGILLLPMAMFCITIAAPGVSIYESTGVLMIPAITYIFIALAGMLDYLVKQYRTKEINSKKRYVMTRFVVGTEVILLVVLLSTQIRIVSDAQTYSRHMYNKTKFMASQMMQRIEEVATQNDTRQICIIGTPEDGNYPELYGELKSSVQWMTSSYGTIWSGFIPTQYGWTAWFEQELGVHYDVISEEAYNNILDSEQFEEMVLFPQEGSVQMIDGTVVVKLSNPR